MSQALLNHVKERADKATALLIAVKDGKYPRHTDDLLTHGANPEWALRVVSGELAWCELYLERNGIGDTDTTIYEQRQEEIKKKFTPVT